MSLPLSPARLFDPSESSKIDPARHAPRVIVELLESGSTEDLRWLTTHYDLDSIRDWLHSHGARQLSRRSFAFWILYLDGPVATQVQQVENDLWLL